MTIETPNGQLVIKPYHIAYLKQLKMSLSEIMVLESYWVCIKAIPIEIQAMKEVKILQDRYLVNGLEATEIGCRLLQDLYNLQPSPLKKIALKSIQPVYSDDYEQWWITYPASAKFQYKGRTFTSTRGLRDKKEEVYPLYQEARSIFTAEQLLNALKVEIEERKIESWKSRNPDYNAMHYMKATAAYLRSGRYKLYIDEIMPIVEPEKRIHTTSTDM